MGANFPRVKTWVSTEDVTFSDLNAEFDNILNNLTAANVDDFSANVAQMQSTVDPGEVGTESLATSVAGEIQRLRQLIAEITGEDEWYESPVSSLLGLANSIGTGLTDNRIVSGAVISSGTNDMPVFLKAAGTATTVSVQGSATNFVYYVNGIEYTISTNVTLTGLTAAPSSQNTCLINDAQAADDYYTKHAGEDGSIIPVDTMGTEISSLVGKFAAFKIAGTTDEYFIALVESTTALSRAWRGYFFDSTQAPVPRAGYTNNDTITLMKLTWVFAKSDGTLTATYTNPVWSKDEPTSPALGDYWFDLANSTWKTYGVGSYATANAHLIGVCIQDGTNTIAARSFEFFANYAEINTYELAYESATQLKARHPGGVANVWGQTIKADRNIRTWDITLDRDSGVSESASTYYYAYLTQVGDVIISDVKPFDRREDLQGHYHPFASWRCLGRFFNDGSSDIDANTVNSYFTRAITSPLREESAASHIEVIDKIVRLTGASSAHYLPPAAKMKGQSLVFVHAGTALSQVYTITAFGAETFSLNSATTFLLHTTGQSLRILSDGVGWIVLSHNTAWTSSGLTLNTTTGITSTGGGSPVIGTTTTNSVIVYRNGARAKIVYALKTSGAGTNPTAGDFLVALPANIASHADEIVYTTGSGGSPVTAQWVAQGVWGGASLGGTGQTQGFPQLYDTTHFRIVGLIGASGAIWYTSSAYTLTTTSFQVGGHIDIRIAGWEA
jgi:hypothetical protein